MRTKLGDMTTKNIISNSLKFKSCKRLICEFQSVYSSCEQLLGCSSEAMFIKSSIQKTILLLIEFKDSLPKERINIKSTNIDSLVNIFEYDNKYKGVDKVL